MQDFDSSFRNFLENREYTNDDTALYELMLYAFRAGWQAAGGE